MSTRKDLQILRTLATSTEPLSVEDIADRTGLLQHTITCLMFIMARDGWARWESGPFLNIQWAITDEGRRALAKAEASP